MAFLDPQQIRTMILSYFRDDPTTGRKLWRDLGGPEYLKTWKRVEKQGCSVEDFWEDDHLDAAARHLADQDSLYYVPAPMIEWQNQQLMLLARDARLVPMICKAYQATRKIPADPSRWIEQFAEALLKGSSSSADPEQIKYVLGYLAETLYRFPDPRWRSLEDILALIPEDEDVLRVATSTGQSAGLIEFLEEWVSFTHPLFQRYFASCLLEEAMVDNRPATQFWPQAAWWQIDSWDHAASMLAARRDPLAVARWLARANVLLAERVVRQNFDAPDEVLITLDIDRIAYECFVALYDKEGARLTWIYWQERTFPLVELIGLITRLSRPDRMEWLTSIVAKVSAPQFHPVILRLLKELGGDNATQFWAGLSFANEEINDASFGMLGEDRQRPVILFVNDTETIADLVKYMLDRYFRGKPYTWIWVRCCTLGLLCCQLLKPDIMMTDLKSPGLNGIEMIRLLKSDPITQHVLIAVLSAGDAFQAEVEAFGVEKFLSVPAKPSELVAFFAPIIAGGDVA